MPADAASELHEILRHLLRSLNFTRWFRDPGNLESLRDTIEPLAARVAKVW